MKPAMQPADEGKEDSGIILRVLQSRDSMFHKLLLSTLNVILYRYTDSWSRLPVEGALYVYQREDTPSLGLLVLNRKTPRDFHLLVDSGVVGVEVFDRFIIIKRAIGWEIEVYGLWFYDSQASIAASFIIADKVELLKKSKDLLLSLQSLR
ncbi:hypothetical protein NEHOM01_2279 [Nematocida homosporus]|uniref:uncharacterized protein n=1 Tax=Nematocida homosporus TaxID=1912981 RepID=UPI00221F6C3C|nr:uncharacterized protein NEHOM01_2279 [Nematocida homosporus]KAI5187571.1 hypothetical protein NEHOM01_2279 [Nematocida homosporus]